MRGLRRQELLPVGSVQYDVYRQADRIVQDVDPDFRPPVPVHSDGGAPSKRASEPVHDLAVYRRRESVEHGSGLHCQIPRQAVQ